MNFELSDVETSWRSKGHTLGRELSDSATSAAVIAGAARVGLLDPGATLLAVAVAVEALAAESAAAGIALALHSAAARTVSGEPRFSALMRGDGVGALTLSTEAVPLFTGDVLNGRVSWVAPLTDRGIAIIAGRRGAELIACAVLLDTPGVSSETVRTAALRGLVCGHLTLEDAACVPMGPTVPVMIRARILIAAAGIGMGRRAVRDALDSARGTSKGAGGEQSVQGLVADAATDLDAAMLLMWKAATTPLSLAAASMAKLASTVAAQRAIERATQVVGADSFRRGHGLEQLAQDVRALELFAGRTEALREAVAVETLPT